MEAGPQRLQQNDTQKISYEQVQAFRLQNRFTEAELTKLEQGETSLFQLEQQLTEEKLKAEAEILQFMQLNKDNPIDYFTIAFKTQVNSETSPARLALITEQIRIQNEQLQAEKQTQDQISENPAIESIYRQIRSKISSPEAKKWIGEKQIRSFLSFYQNAFKYQITTPEQAQEMLKAMENSTDGLKPRKEFYENILEPKLKDYGLEIRNTNLLRNEGLSERKEAINIITKTETLLDDSVKQNFMVGAVKREYIKKMLQASSIKELQEMHQEVKECNRMEHQTHGRKILEQQISVNGKTINLFSKTDRETIKRFHQNENDPKKKTTYLNWLPDMEKKAKQQYQELQEIFKNNPKELDQILLQFSETQYHQRKPLLDQYRLQQLEKSGKLDKEIDRLQNIAITSIEKAKSQNIISQSTYQDFIRYAQNRQQFINPQTQKFDLTKYQDFIAKMTSDTPIFDRENRNLKAYALRREKFLKTLDYYQQINPEFKSFQYKQALDSYNQKTYSERKSSYLKLKEEINNFEKQQETKKQNHRTLNNLTDKAITQSSTQTSIKDYEKTTWEEIYKNFKNSNISTKEINEYLDENKIIIEHKISAYKQNWLREKQKLDKKDQEKEQKTQEQQKAEAFEKIKKAFKKNLQYQKSDLTQKTWAKEKKQFKETLLIRSQQDILKFDKAIVSEYLDLHADEIDKTLEQLYQNWQKEFEESNTEEAKNIQEISSSLDQKVNDILKPTTQEEQEQETTITKIPLEEPEIPSLEKEKNLPPEPEKEPEKPEEPEEPEEEPLPPEPEKEPEEEEPEPEKTKESEEEPPTFQIPKELQTFITPSKLQQFTKEYQTTEIQTGSTRLTQLMTQNPHLRTLLQTGNSSENTIFMILTLNQINQFHFTNFQTKVANKKTDLSTLFQQLIKLIGINETPKIFQNRLNQTWAYIQKYLKANQTTNTKSPEKEEEETDQETIEQLKKVQTETQIEKNPETKEIQETEIVIPEIEEQNQTQPTQTPIPEEQNKEENLKQEQINPEQETEKTEEPSSLFQEPEPLQTIIYSDPSEEQPEETIEITEPIEQPIEQTEQPLSPFQESEEPQIIENQEPEEPQTTENFIEEITEQTEDSDKTNEQITIEELFSGKMNEMPQFILEQIIHKSLEPQNIKNTITQIELILKNPTEQTTFPLFTLLKIMYKMNPFTDLEEFCTNLTRFISDFTGKKITYKLQCPLNLRAMFLAKPQEIFAEILKKLPKELEIIETFNFSVQEKSSYLNTTQAIMDFTIITSENQTTSRHEFKLATKEFLKGIKAI